MIPTAEQFASSASALGIQPESNVVVYDTHGVFSSPRTAFTFASFGHESVAVLDGGLPRWKAEGFEIEYGAPAAFDVSSPSKTSLPVFTSLMFDFEPGSCFDVLQSAMYPTPTQEASSTVSYEAMVANIPSQTNAVLDARPRPRFTAEAPEPRPGLPSGHIPGSRSLPFGELVKDGRLLSEEEVRFSTL